MERVASELNWDQLHIISCPPQLHRYLLRISLSLQLRPSNLIIRLEPFAGHTSSEAIGTNRSTITQEHEQIIGADIPTLSHKSRVKTKTAVAYLTVRRRVAGAACRCQHGRKRMEVEPVALGWVVLGKEPAECLRARVRRVDELHVNVVADGVGTVFLD